MQHVLILHVLLQLALLLVLEPQQEIAQGVFSNLVAVPALEAQEINILTQAVPAPLAVLVRHLAQVLTLALLRVIVLVEFLPLERFLQLEINTLTLHV
jgi:hypothetical protein